MRRGLATGKKLAFLAQADSQCRDELWADFRETYHLSLWEYDLEGEHIHLAQPFAALALQLPTTSRVRRNLTPGYSYDIDTQLLRCIEYNQRLYAWNKTKEAQTPGAQPPDELTLPGEEAEHERRVDAAERDARELAKAFGLNL